MGLSRLKISNFRNLNAVDIQPCQDINLFYGANGSGKTSLLESIYYISFARSFRSRISSHIIQNNKDQFSVFAEIDANTLGVERNRQGGLAIRFNTGSIVSASELSKLLPLQLIYPDSYQLLNDGSKIRRQFIDWGVFHVEHQIFFPLWKRMRKILQQRNVVLKNKKFQAKPMIKAWDIEFAEIARTITGLRSDYINNFYPIFDEILCKLLPDKAIKMKFKPGWDNTQPFENILERELEKDFQFGFTRFGPHRADLEISIEHHLAKNILSRGEQKALVCAMRLAQARILEKTHEQCVFLIDDLPSELDEEKRKIFCDMISHMKTQLFITGISSNSLKNLFAPKLTKMFHVEHGSIREIEKHDEY
ncbi:MAG: DNA replication/repair protein RecF [Gammaproteobacteria bacterium]|nr:DNA replication/repair protein RecF [Gammaproteobacteria bacterium]